MILLIARYVRLLTAFVLVLSACTGVNQTRTAEHQARELPVVEETNAIELSAGALDLGAVALKDFRTKSESWKCFDVLMYSQDEYWRVDFLPSDDVKRAGNMISVGASKCGDGVSYVINRNGEIERVIYAR